MRRAVAIILAALALLVRPDAGRAQGLAADISDHLIAITTAFTGTTVTLFGISEKRADIIVTVIGPREEQVVRRKDRVAGIWINVQNMAFADVPEYYFVASSRPIQQIAHPDIQARLELGLEHIALRPVDAEGRDISDILAFRDALIRNKQRADLYAPKPGVVRFVGEKLFRTQVPFPANVPPGIYQVQVFELVDGQVADAQRSTLVISKIGLEAEVFDFAQNRAPLYGIAAIIISIVAGWLAGIIFRRG
jgi:uncharacterized protein (TIGR02186 family)